MSSEYSELVFILIKNIIANQDRLYSHLLVINSFDQYTRIGKPITKRTYFYTN